LEPKIYSFFSYGKVLKVLNLLFYLQKVVTVTTERNFLTISLPEKAIILLKKSGCKILTALTVWFLSYEPLLVQLVHYKVRVERVKEYFFYRYPVCNIIINGDKMN